MKHIVLILFTILAFTTINAQVPHAFKYQAVIRNSQGKTIVNQLVSLKISILSNLPTGEVVYSEKHQAYTNDYGIVNLNIGSGTVLSGTFIDIPWSSTTHYLKTELDITGNQNYEFIGTTQLLSVPYAFYAEKSGTSDNDLDSDPLNEIQTIIKNGNTITLSNNGGTYTDSDNQLLNINGSTLAISNGNSVQLPPEIDGDINNEIQFISLINDTLYLTNGGQIYLGNYMDNTDNQNLSINGNQLSISGGNSINITGAVDLDADPINELQYLSFSNDTLYLSQGNFVVLPHEIDLDLDSLNEIQTLSQSGTDITLSKNGGTISIADNDNDSLNEIQNLTYSNDTLRLTNSSSIYLPSAPSNYCINSIDSIPPVGLTYSGTYVLTNSSPKEIIVNNIGLNYTNYSLLSFDNNVYIFGGENGGLSIPESYSLNLTSHSIQSISSMPTARSRSTACLLQNKIYVIGGYIIQNSQYTPKVEAYDPITNSWENKADLPIGDQYIRLTVLNNQIYALSNYSGAFYVYNPGTDTWSGLQACPLSNCVIANNNNFIYAFNSTSVSRFNTGNNQWTTLQNDLSLANSLVYCFVYNSRIFICTSSGSIYEYYNNSGMSIINPYMTLSLNQYEPFISNDNLYILSSGQTLYKIKVPTKYFIHCKN